MAAFVDGYDVVYGRRHRVRPLEPLVYWLTADSADGLRLANDLSILFEY
jgi:hypothetical protein